MEPYSPKGPENVKSQHYIDVQGDFLGPPHGHNDSYFLCYFYVFLVCQVRTCTFYMGLVMQKCVFGNGRPVFFFFVVVFSNQLGQQQKLARIC